MRNPSSSARTGDSSDMKLETTDKKAKDNKYQKHPASVPAPLQMRLTMHCVITEGNGKFSAEALELTFSRVRILFLSPKFSEAEKFPLFRLSVSITVALHTNLPSLS